MRWTEEEYADYLNKACRSPCKPTQKNKYGATKVWADGICFDSKKEAEFYRTLQLLQKAGEIKGFCRQARFVVTAGTDKDNRAAEYVTDFIVFYRDGTYRIIDTKGMQTRDFKLKIKAFREKYPELTVELE